MIAHTPTLFASVALVATIMAFCLILVGQLNKRDGLFTTGCGLLAHALAYVCYTLYGQASLWLTYGLANLLLSLALALYTAGIFRIRELRVPWPLIASLPALMALLMATLINTLEPRMLAASGVLTGQCLLLVYWAYRHARSTGRSYMLLIIGGGISLIGLNLRVIAILAGGATEMQYDVSNLKQTISVSIGTVTVMMYSLGLVLLSNERSESRLRQMARHDVLTGILNRRAILEQLAEELERARRCGSTLAIAMIDIDHFKQINDQHGHLAGDEVLCHCVRNLQQRLRQSDCIGRYGGEEFLLLLPATSAEGAMVAVDALREALAQAPAHYAGATIPLTFSAGLWCGVPGPDDSTDQLIARADKALYAAKAGGRNCLSLSAPTERLQAQA